MEHDNKRVAIYARQSHTTEGSSSLSMQVEICRDTAARFGLTVGYELIEARSTSGYKNRGRSRPRFLELLALIAAGAIDGVVVYKLDRLSRGGGVGWAPLVDAVETIGLNMNRFVLTPNGWTSEMEIGFRATMDREESEKLSERMLDLPRS
jgi:DNA invertase Pin-like site-specific DNA recombinase